MSTPGAFDAVSAPETLPDGGSSSLADGEWHRMHPLTPLFKGGLALLVVAGIVISNMRDKVIGWVVKLFAPAEAGYVTQSGDPVDWVLENNLVLLALAAVLGLVVLLVAIFWFLWRFQQFRITGHHVEVRKGLLFRSHRRAPLDRVQGVNLTRPFPARLIGLAKLEVVGAGNDANVPLEYLSTPKAEAVRADILRLAAGARSARLVASGSAPQQTTREQIVGSMNAGVSGLIEGVDLADVAPESVVKIPTGRLIGSQLVIGVLWFLFFGAIFVISISAMYLGMTADGENPADIALGLVGLGLGMGIPLVIAVVGITWAQISKSLRYSIASTPDGVRITFGLLTTVTETLPPGRIFAVEVSQSLLWRPFGWWTVKINRMTGKSAAQQSSGNAQQFSIVLPVGRRADVERVLGLVMPGIPPHEIAAMWESGVTGPVADDPYKTIPARAAWRRPLSWKRHGYRLTEHALLVRRGFLWRRLAVFPLARLQSVSISQSPLERLQRVSRGQVHSVTGPVTGHLSGLERDDAIALLDGVSRAAAHAASNDRTHRWAEWQQATEA
ncbi:PH domain-containing protein [Microbacterium esteraromaticum]|uniref:PH domain-containing protein n=1 Tax=Microbacterium esteraromaticum TaxID=57043 RepID=UPI001D338D74|nr:putative membrane protein [Microbacterium esteraromaticum]